MGSQAIEWNTTAIIAALLGVTFVVGQLYLLSEKLLDIKLFVGLL